MVKAIIAGAMILVLGIGSAAEARAPQCRDGRGHFTRCPPATAPAARPAPARANPAPSHNGATAKCRDNSLSYSAHRQGTCSHHGGVAQWY